MKKIIGFGLLLIMGVCMLCGCSNVPEGSFYTLQEAYDNGWLTQEDLMSIAYYHNGGREYNEAIMPEDYKPIAPMPLKSVEKTIRLDYWNDLYDINRKMHKKDDIAFEYFGTYNSCVAVKISLRGTAYEWEDDADYCGVTIHYCDTERIQIWKKEDPNSTADDNANGLADGLEWKIRTAYYNSELNIDAGNKIERIQDIRVKWYFGEFNGAHAVCWNPSPLDVYYEETVDGITFGFPSPTYIHVYYRDGIYSMQEAVDKGILTHEDIVTIHEEYERQS